jgi:hypothetical protein
MAKYNECPNCGNFEYGTRIYKCGECNKTFCEECEGKPDYDALDKAVSMLIPGDPMPLCPSCDEIVYETVCKIGDSD